METVEKLTVYYEQLKKSIRGKIGKLAMKRRLLVSEPCPDIVKAAIDVFPLTRPRRRTQNVHKRRNSVVAGRRTDHRPHLHTHAYTREIELRGNE